MSRNKFGFSLIEMAIALAIISFMAGQVLAKLPGFIHYKKAKQTKESIELIKESLYAYILINDKFPCPDIDDDGQQDLDSLGECEQEQGYLPWADLGVDRYDSWYNPFNYAMDANFLNKLNASPYLTTKYEIKSSFDEVVVEPLLFYAVVWSEGRNDNDTTDELENRNNDNVFVMTNHVENKFDDIVIGIPRYNLVHKLLRTRRLPNYDL